MNDRRLLIKVYEASVTILASYLAVSSFFNSSLYNTITGNLSQLLRLFNIRTISSSQISLIIPLLVTLIVSLIIVYDYILGKPENIMDLYQINLLMITPEVLSFSRLNWLNLIKRPQILEPTRSPTMVYLTGAIILVGYVSLYFISKSRLTAEELIDRGVDVDAAENVFFRQSQLAVSLVLVSVALASIIFFATGPLNAVLASLLGVSSYSYILFGVSGAALLLLAFWMFLKGEDEKGLVV